MRLPRFARFALTLTPLLVAAACNRDATPAPAPAPQQETAAQPSTQAATTAPAPIRGTDAAPVADDTTQDAARHIAGGPMPVLLTTLQDASLNNGAIVSAQFAKTKSDCTVQLERTIPPGEAGEGRLTCEQPVALEGGDFAFTAHAAGRHVADGVVLP